VLVNLIIAAVGVLLINALLIVPAATAANWSRNMRQFFRRSVLLAVAAGLIGFQLSLTLTVKDPAGQSLKLGVSGLIVVVSVLLFTLSMVLPSATIERLWTRLRGTKAAG
jgi:zinc transport system permease protein